MYRLFLRLLNLHNLLYVRQLNISLSAAANLHTNCVSINEFTELFWATEPQCIGVAVKKGHYVLVVYNAISSNVARRRSSMMPVLGEYCKICEVDDIVGICEVEYATAI